MLKNSLLSLVAVLGISVHAFAVDITPSQFAMLGMDDITTVFGASQTSTVENYVASGDGVGVLVNWDDTGEGFTRVVFQRASVDADWSAFDNFSVTFDAFGEDIGVKPYVQTGDGFAFFETEFTSIAAADGPTAVALDLTALADTNNVRQFGWQIFGPGGTDLQSTVLISPTAGATQYLPEPSSLSLIMIAGLGLLSLRRR